MSNITVPLKIRKQNKISGWRILKRGEKTQPGDLCYTDTEGEFPITERQLVSVDVRPEPYKILGVDWAPNYRKMVYSEEYGFKHPHNLVYRRIQ